MKIKPLLFIFALVSCFFANAQFHKGDRVIGASVASLVFNSGSSDITVANIGSNTSVIKNHNVLVNPSMGWFMGDHSLLGVQLSLNPYGAKTTYEQNGSTYQSDKSNSYNLGIGGYFRQYLKGRDFLPFVQLGLNGGLSNLKTEGFFYGGSGVNAYKNSYDGNSKGGGYLNAAFTAGFTKMINETAGLDFYVGYTYSYNKNTFKKTTLRDLGNNGTIDERLENETTTKYTNNGLLAGVGFQIFLRGKKK